MVSVLCGVIGLLWKDCRKWQTKFMNERQKRIEDAKEHYRTSEMFLTALKQQRRTSSDPPSSSH